jgi:hypothetical protein
MMPELPKWYSLEQVAEKLRQDPARLKKWLRKNPFSRDGRPHSFKIGGSVSFAIENITLIYYQLRDLGLITEQIDVWDGVYYEHDKQAPEGFVYFIDGGDCIKVGYSRSLESRSKKMSTDAPVELKVLHIEPGTFKQEKIFHRHFAAIRLRGEWFRKTPGLLAFIEQRKRIKAMAEELKS